MIKEKDPFLLLLSHQMRGLTAIGDARKLCPIKVRNSNIAK